MTRDYTPQGYQRQDYFYPVWVSTPRTPDMERPPHRPRWACADRTGSGCGGRVTTWYSLAPTDGWSPASVRHECHTVNC
ncbi:hypothetical protein GOTRE_109_00320 [Gordonia terrae NBRC 100016]|uniref:Uncharacterized protein n=1 Tax=Gordonia terrae NBRC 100016 TaxID=1089454 RepID=A0ABQ0HH00_9ACTN|nr:hypothetical protein GOTRE_109_00320 [Gordonia terrae NBRC 100016]